MTAWGFKWWVMEGGKGGGEEKEWEGMIESVCVCVCVCVCVRERDSIGGGPCGANIVCVMPCHGASWQGPKLAWQNVTEDPESRDSGNPDTIMLMAGAKAQI